MIYYYIHTNSCLSDISAKRLHIPIFHMEAGNRCKDECLPEENLSTKVVKIIQSYTGVVNKMVWKK